MEGIIENSIAIMILLTASIIFDILTIIYNVLDLLFGIGLVIGPIFNFVPLLFFSIFSLAKAGTEEIGERINQAKNTDNQNENPKAQIQKKIGKAKKAIKLVKELLDSAKAYGKSSTPIWGLTFPWTRKALGEIWKQYAHL